MTKSERLIYLVQLIRQKRVATVAQLSSSCGVSERTIYRDVLSLSRMNVPIHYNNGYRLAQDVGIPNLGLESPDIELMLFCLRQNPLQPMPFFAERFQYIETLLRERFKSGSEAENG